MTQAGESTEKLAYPVPEGVQEPTAHRPTGASAASSEPSVPSSHGQSQSGAAHPDTFGSLHPEPEPEPDPEAERRKRRFDLRTAAIGALAGALVTSAGWIGGLAIQHAFAVPTVAESSTTGTFPVDGRFGSPPGMNGDFPDRRDDTGTDDTDTDTDTDTDAEDTET